MIRSNEILDEFNSLMNITPVLVIFQNLGKSFRNPSTKITTVAPYSGIFSKLLFISIPTQNSNGAVGI